MTTTLTERPVKICAAEGCEVELPTGGKGEHFRKFCEAHAPPPKRKKGDQQPRSINVNLGQPRVSKKDAELEAVENRARQIAQILAALVLLAGQAEDSGDIAKGADQWAKAVRDLSEYEAWLRKIAAGGEASARAVAWVQFAVATAAIALPILLRHKILPGNIAEIAATFIGVAEALPKDAPQSEPDGATSVAA